MTDEDKVDQIMGDVREIKTLLEKVVEPAISKVYDNERAIIRVQGFQRVIKYVGSTTVGATVLVTAKMIYSFISKHPPPNIHP